MEISIAYLNEPSNSRLVIGHHLNLQEEIQKALPSSRRLAIITDENMIPYIHKRGFTHDVFCFAAGESHKTRTTKEYLEDALLHAGFGRDTTIVGIGGGVVTDLAGFIAATFCRGVPFIAIPTTLMGMVDASIGGKTGVNTTLAKNMIGAFHPPVSVLIDTVYLSTLPEEQFHEGLSEIVKQALIASPELFSALLDNYPAWQRKDPEFLRILIYESCKIKAAIVQKDPFEKGLRRILNFGHTIAHALEIVSDHRLSHGKAVAIGIMLESHLSYKLGALSLEDLQKIEKLYALYNLPSSTQDYDTHALIKAMRLDKKNIQECIRVVTLDKIGSASSHGETYCTPVEIEKMYDLLTQLVPYLTRETEREIQNTRCAKNRKSLDLGKANT